MIRITPPNAQLQIELSVSAGILAIVTFVEPDAQGAAVTGTHGIGVSTPSAAAVAAATAGFAKLRHMPNGMMFTSGLLSMMFAAGRFVAKVPFRRKTLSDDGATPKLQLNIAPMTTCVPI